MKSSIFLFTILLCLTSGTFAQQKDKSKAPLSKSATPNKYKDNVDDRMKGPKGEKIYIGEKGGRYYLKNGKKVYVPYKGSPKNKQ